MGVALPNMTSLGCHKAIHQYKGHIMRYHHVVSILLTSFFSEKKTKTKIKYTVNVVIFAGGKFRENVGKTFHVGGNFHYTTPIFFIKAHGFYFRVGVIFANMTNARKTRKLPHAKISRFIGTNTALIIICTVLI